MKLQVSSKVAGPQGKKPHIKKGYYNAKLLQVKPRQDKDGNWVESKFGRQIILLFQVLDDNNKPIKNPEDKAEDLILAQVLNSEYKNEDGSYRTAVTKNSRITKVFEALGWTFDPNKPVDTDYLIGKEVELNIDDYETTDSDGNSYKASSIKDINKLEEEETPSSSSSKEEPVKQETEPKPLDAAKQDRVTKMKKMHEEGMLSEEGLKKAIEQIENE